MFIWKRWSATLAVTINIMLVQIYANYLGVIVRLIIRANSQLAERIDTLWGLRENIEELKVCMRICKEIEAFRNLNSFVYAMEETILLARQNEGWIKSIESYKKIAPVSRA